MLWLLLIPVVPILTLAILWLIGERGRLILPSTRAALRGRDGEPGGSGSGGVLNALHGYVYGRWTEQYIALARRVLPRLSPATKRKWADHYHVKVLPTDLACSIIKLDHDIPRTDLERIIPYPTARDLLLSGPPSVTLLGCPCRAGRQPVAIEAALARVVDGKTLRCAANEAARSDSSARNGVPAGSTRSARSE